MYVHQSAVPFAHREPDGSVISVVLYAPDGARITLHGLRGCNYNMVIFDLGTLRLIVFLRSAEFKYGQCYAD
jgi:hypothetical protein